jgi:ATP-dependent Lon protease
LHAEEIMTEFDTIPLFPLGIVALPGQPVPLHIFEERYKQMIGDCLKADQPFGIVYFSGERMNAAGCTVRVAKVLKRYEDGRMDIITHGEQRFVIDRIIEEKAYLEADVSYFNDIPEPFSASAASAAELGVSLLAEISELLLGREDDAMYVTDDPELLSFVLAGNDGFEAEEKQQFLEMTSTNLRLEKCTRALESIVERLRLTTRIKKIIGGNGHLDHGP